MLDLTQFSYEELAHALYIKGERHGFTMITDKMKWREAVVAEKLGHIAFPKISAGKDSENYGADADDPFTGRKAEYKSTSIDDNQIRNLMEKIKSVKKGSRYAPLTIGGVYNGAYTHEAIDKYEDHDHYFGIFYKELCVMIMRVDTNEVIGQLHEEVNRRAKLKKQGTTNLNTVTLNLKNKHLYQVVYRDEAWFEAHKD